MDRSGSDVDPRCMECPSSCANWMAFGLWSGLIRFGPVAEDGKAFEQMKTYQGGKRDASMFTASGSRLL
jgi:hypothetical protein